MVDINIPKENENIKDVYDFGFDKSLNKISPKLARNPLFYDNIQDATNPELLSWGKAKIGKDDNVFKITNQGINLGDANFSESPFRVSMDGIVETKTIFFLREYHSTSFESLDGWFTKEAAGSGTITIRLGSLYLKTGATIGSTVRIFNNELSVAGIKGSKSSAFETCFFVGTLSTNQVEIITGVGDAGQVWGEDDGTANSYGFKIINKVLMGYSNTTTGTDKLESTVEITGVTLPNFNVYRAIHTSSKNVKFYVNGSYMNQVTTNLPSGNNDCTFVFGITNKEAANKEFYTRYAIFAQDI